MIHDENANNNTNANNSTEQSGENAAASELRRRRNATRSEESAEEQRETANTARDAANGARDDHGVVAANVSGISVDHVSKSPLPPLSSLAPIRDIKRICVGMSVKIERSNGHVQTARVTTILHEKNGAAVEWQEQGETKTKEVDIEMLVRNNPEVFGISPSSVLSKNFPNLAKIINTMSYKNMNAVAVLGSDDTDADNMGETKAKEVDNQMLVRNNPEVFGISPSSVLSKNFPHLAKIINNKLLAGDTVKSLQNPQRHEPAVVQPAQLTLIDRTNNEENGKEKRCTRLTKNATIPDVILEVDEEVMSERDENEPVLIEPSAPQSNNKRSQLFENPKEMEKNREQLRDKAKRQRETQQIQPGAQNSEFLTMIRDYQSQLVYRPLSLEDEVMDNRICVCVRKRPLGKRELASREVDVITMPNRDHVIVHQPQVKVDLTKYLVNHKFRFDYVFNEAATNEMVYRFSAQPLVRTIFQRGFATCFAYGQTGSGKTYTMGGTIEGRRQVCSNGIYAMTAHDVFAMLHSPEYANQKLTLSCSFFEIYGSKMFDLLNKKSVLRILEDGKHLVQVVGLRETKVHSVDELPQNLTMNKHITDSSHCQQVFV
ncbi:hypothetical protein niasHT_035891 [Heterodera trifolii]|uniref:Kinesin motor domain-containing protein n=1 Tax=Heterodera trifolii TaxID=157864 RepID=A0ABD2IGD8_9BILA